MKLSHDTKPFLAFSSSPSPQARMNSSRPMRKAKQIAIDNIKKSAMTLNAYDKNGSPLRKEVTLQDAIELYKSSKHSMSLFALLPPQFRCEEYWFDVIDVLLYINRDRLPSDIGGYPTSKKFYDAIAYYQYFTTEAKQYVLDRYCDEEDRLCDESYFACEDAGWESSSIVSDVSERSKYWTPTDYGCTGLSTCQCKHSCTPLVFTIYND